MRAGVYEEKPWLALYPPGQPACIEADFSNLLDAFRASLRKAPDAPILYYFDTPVRLAELDQASTALAAELVARGFRSGDRLALYTQNNPAYVIGLLATWKAGGIAVAVNPMSKERELQYILRDSGARALLSLDTLHAEIGRSVTVALDGQVDIVVTFSALDGQSLNDTRVLDVAPRLGALDGALDLHQILTQGAAATVAPWHPRADDLALLVYTSGTTGHPKGAMITHANLAFNAQTYRDWIGLSMQDSILGMAPLFHITGIVGHVAAALLIPCPLVLLHRFHPATVLDAMRRHRPTFTIGAITAFISLMNAPGAQREDFSSFRAIYSGGAPVSPATVEQFEAFSGHYIHNAYGMTETCSPTHIVPFGVRAPVDPQSGALSIGVPVFNTTVRVVDDDGRDVPVGETGEFIDRGPQIMRGYWNMPEATAAAIPDGWLRTGDVGFMDEQGWFYLVDRKKDMINAGGYKVWPREVEDVLYSHPAVREVAVVGVPDAYRGETVKAVVSLKPGMQVSAEDLIAYCKANMADYKYPRILEFMDELPKTLTGKLLRRSLR